MLAIIFAAALVVGSTSLLRQHRLWPESQYLKPFLGSAFGRRVLLYQHSWPSCEQMLGPWATLFDFPLWYSSAARSIGLLKVASLSTAPLPTAPSGVSSCHSDTGKHWQLVGFALRVSAARRAPPLIIMGRALSVGSCLPVTSPPGPCLTVSHSLESANWHHRTAFLSPARPNQAKGPNYQIRILQAFSSRSYFPLLTPGP